MGDHEGDHAGDHANDHANGHRGRDPWLALLQPPWLASLVPAALRLARAARAPARAQGHLLRGHLRALAGSAYHRAHVAGRVDSVATFQRRVPIVDHDALAPWIARIAAGEPNVLTRDPVRFFERSGGSTGTTTKLVPYTAGLLADFAAATNPWLLDLHRRHPDLIGRPSYWSLSPVARGARHTEGGVPIGIDDDTAYFGPVRRFVLARTMAVPPSVAHAPDVATWRRQTLVALLTTPHLGLVSIWSPTFLTTLLAHLRSDPDPIAAALPPDRRRALWSALPHADLGRRLFPALRVISTWADGPSAAFLPELAAAFPTTAIEPKGLLATEGVVSIPLGGPARPGGLLALTSTFVELAPVDRLAPDGTVDPATRPALAHELEVGREYTPLLTTRGGLVRYHLKDVVRAVAPLRLQFVGKLDQVSDLAGEKIHARAVELGLAAARAALGLGPRAWDFALLAPASDPAPHYRLYLDSDAPAATLDALAAALDRHLASGHAYRYCRDLGQLGPVIAQRVAHGRDRWLAAQEARGQRLGDIKPTWLDRRPFWPDVFVPDPEPPR